MFFFFTGMKGFLAKYPHDSAQAKKYTQLVAAFVVDNFLPYRLIELPAFKAMIQALDPRYVVPSRKTFSEKIIPNMYDDLAEGQYSQ